MTTPDEIIIENYPHDRIRTLTPSSLNQVIDQKANIDLKSTVAIGPLAIADRLEELNQEWDVDRWMMAIYSSLVIVQLYESFKKSEKKWLIGPLIQTPFLLMHAIMGWCPPTLLLRKLGVRTKFEIEAEKNALLRVLYERDWENKQNEVFIEDWSNDVF